MNRACKVQTASNTYDRLREAALELFSTHGYQSTSLRDLARHLGVQAGSIYNHVESKQSLLFELMEETLDDLMEETRQNLSGAGTTQSRLKAFIQAYVAFQSRGRRRLELIERELVNLTDEQREHIVQMRARYRQNLIAIIGKELAGARVSSSSLQMLGYAVLGMMHGLPTSTEAPSQAVVDQLSSMISGAIAATKQQPIISSI